MRKYEKYVVKDFIMDDYFRQWVMTPTPESDEFWEYWLKLHPSKKKEVIEARRLLLMVDFEKTAPPEIPADLILSRIRSSIRQGTLTAGNRKQHGQLWLKIAASIILIALVGGLLVFTIRQSSRVVGYETAYGEKRRIELPDHSVVMLNANSKLQFNRDWSSDKIREVWLHGEAFFEVQKSPGKGNARFIVHTKALDVEVLGTVFNVNDRREKTQVVLRSGKVKLTSDRAIEKEITMLPGEMAELKKGDKRFTKKTVNPQVYSSWASDKLIFNKTSFEEIVNLIEDNYGYKVEASVEGIEKITFTATIPSTDLDVLLRILSESYDVTITKQDKTIIINKKATQTD